MNKRQHLVIIITLLLGILPVNVFAQYSSSDTTKSCGTTNNKEWQKACKTKYGINIAATPYNRDTGINSNDVKSRKITITAAKNVNYKIRIFIADYGDLEKLEVDGKNSIDQDDLEAEDIKLKKANMTTGSYEYSLPAGKEALVVVYLKNDEDSGKTCKTSSGTKEVVKCKAGNYSIEEEEGTVKGNAASLFVENPNETGLVTNLRYRGNKDFGQACNNAYHGYYMDKNAKKVEGSQYNVANENKDDWRQNYYNKVLGNNYCEKQSVAFNLKESQIANISNKLLKIYYESNKLRTQTTGSYETVKNEIENIKKSINDENRIFYESKGQKPNITDLKCDENAKDTKSKDYLYITKDESVKTKKLSNGHSYKVCDTQCYEHLTVSYSPPVASKAGLCFTYKVTVKSETKCGVNTSTDYLNGLLSKEACSPTPVCENASTKTQAGPSQEFDDCVKECDGGEYSQSCINKCYKKVYSKNSTKSNSSNESNKVKTSNTSTKKTSIVLMLNNLTGNKATIKRMSNYDIKNEDNLKHYYKESNYDGLCNTKSIIKYFSTNNTKKQNICAEYYFYAKMLNPYGHYNADGTKWISDNVITDAGATDTNTSHIPMQIGRAAPFYLRDISTTKDLLKSLVGYEDSNGILKKYNIKSSGIKRQYSKRYICKEECKFTGCNKDQALTPHDFVKNTTSDMEEINAALEKCTSTAECDGATDNSEFEITIENPRKNNQKTQKTTITGTTTLHNKDGSTTSDSNISCTSPGNNNATFPSNGKFSMFVPADDDDISKTKTGITGQCYDKDINSPHYKTTITFPGSWINLKTGAVSYKSKCAKNHFDYQDELYCSLYDSANVNTNWWKWRINSGSGAAPKPDVYNIKASLGKETTNKGSKKFGKYNWTIKFKCFYAISDSTGDDDNGGNKPSTKTSADNIDIRFVREDDKLFAGRKYGATGSSYDSGNQIGFNWTKDAQDTTLSKDKAKGYDINPYEYGKSIMSNKEQISSSDKPDVIINLTPDNSSKVKDILKEKNNKNKSYEIGVYDTNGNWTKDKDIPMLNYYNSNILNQFDFVTINYRKGYNYAKK